MARRVFIAFISLTIGFCSCSAVRLKSRIGHDLYLEANSYEQLNGNFSNSNIDTIDYRRNLLYSTFSYDTIYKQNNLIVNITPVDKNKIRLKLLDNETVIDSLTIKGKFKKGYFKVRREINTNFIAGPFLWALVEYTKFIGLTKDNNLVIINSGGSGFLLLIVLPIFAAGGGQTENEYGRYK